VSTFPHALWRSGETALLASRDTETSEWIFPAVTGDSPLAHRHATVPVEGPGVVYSYTVIHPGAHSGLEPYALGYVDFPGPVRIFGRLQGSARPAIGERYRPEPDAALGYVFVALDA
jgi:uncharacterized OB-fold protein